MPIILSLPVGNAVAINSQTYRNSPTERVRTAELLDLLPRGRSTVLEIGARDGYHTRLLTQMFDAVTTIDLSKPLFDIPRVTPLKGNVTQLSFPDRSFDCVLCSEVLEHVHDVEKAAREIARVAKYEVLIGVPYMQDLRMARLTCSECGMVNPPFGHVNTFDADRLTQLFPEFSAEAVHWVGTNKTRTNLISTFLMDFAGNPWGT